MVGINKAISANDIKNGTSVTGVDGTGNMQSYFDTAKDFTTPALADIQSKYDTRFDDPTYYMHSGLIKDLVSYYRLDETSGVRINSVIGATDLTDNNTVGFSTDGVSSKTENCADFVAANLEYLSHDGDELRLGDSDWSIAAWLKTDISSDQDAVGIWKTSANNREWRLWYRSSVGSYQFEVSSDGQSGTVSSVQSGTTSAGTWYNHIIIHDSVSNTIKYYIDGTLKNTTSHSGGAFEGDGQFRMGHTFSSSNFFDGKIDEFGVWSRVISARDISDLYNSGDGRKVK